MRRRDFIKVITGSAVAWPLSSRAQQRNRGPKIGIILNSAETDPVGKSRVSVVEDQLSRLGWADANNVEIEARWAAGKTDLMLAFASQFVSQPVDVIIAHTTPLVAVLKQLTSTIPIVFVAVADPIGPGFVKSFDYPGGNITGFTNIEETMGGKWVELLREIAHSVKRASMLFNPETANAGGGGGIYLKSIETAARDTGTELIVSAVHDPADIDEVFAAMAQGSSGGVLVMPNAFTFLHRERIVAQAERYRVPTIYPQAEFVMAGGLLSYGVDYSDLWRRAASYADRILKGANPGDLPVQQPIKYELKINKKTAIALGLSIPSTLLVAADDVIE
ncbi:MAG TPA: ABC transporter substrate-binding protein [Pseudolabrys sp.]|nr:ABC transporter substrate-binding protein [Pseudolabrys sp.]